MKNIIILLALILTSSLASAQNKSKTDTIRLHTSAQCGMCKTNIEKALYLSKGIKSAELNVKTKMLTVVYKTNKTTVQNIKEIVNNSGYDADESKANPKAYKKLAPCCKKPDDPNYIPH